MSEKDMNNLIEKMHRVEGLMRRYQGFGMRAFGPFASPHRGQGRVLALLKLQPEITQKELSYLLDMRQQSISELLAKLEQKGYITRTPSPEDKRTTVIRLTEEGKVAAEQTDQNEGGMEKILSCLSEEEQANLAGYMDRLGDALEKELEGMEEDWKGFGRGEGCEHGPHGRCGAPPHHGPHGKHFKNRMGFGAFAAGFAGPGGMRGGWDEDSETEE